MTIERGNVSSLVEPPGYMHFAAMTGGRLVFLAGQVPLDEQGELVGPGDHVAQARQCLANLAATLGEIGASPADSVRTTIYVVASEQQHMGDVWRDVSDYNGSGQPSLPG